MKPKSYVFYLLAGLLGIACVPSHADVATPPKPPAVPAGYCSTIYTELQNDLSSFNASIGTPAQYPTLRIAQLQQADANTGPAISGPSYLAGVLTQAQELKAMGFQGLKLAIGFPVLYEPFFGSESAMQPYLTFYQQLASNLHAMGMKVVVENTILQANNAETGWTNLTPFYNSLNWTEYIAARATMAATVAQYVQPDYLVLAEEPDTEAANTGQTNLNNPVDAAAMIAGEITAVRLVSLTMPLGAGFGTWLGQYPPDSLLDYLAAYVVLPLDYIDYHVYPINTEQGVSLLNNALVIAQQAGLALKPVAVSESWLWKMENAEFGVDNPDLFSARNPFSFWGPLDSYFAQTMQNLANYTQAKYTPMLYLSAQNMDAFFAYQTYGGTTANGGAANCTCTTDSCTESTILDNANLDAINADKAADFTATAYKYNQMLVTPPDTVAPTAPSALTGTAGYTSATVSWTGSADNIGVAGYNVLRCAPTPPSKTCTGVWIANATSTSYFDSSLNQNTLYLYQVQAFDMANNNSAKSNTLSLTTFRNTPPNSPQDTTATALSSKAIQVNWIAPVGGGVSQYDIYAGTSKSSLTQIATAPSTVTQYEDQPLLPATTYYFGVIAVAQGLSSPMSNIASAKTQAAASSPNHVTATPGSASTITLTWQETVPSGDLPIASYRIYRGTQPGALSQIATATATTYTDTSLTNGTTYYYEIVAVDANFEDSIPSRQATATTLP
jgi:fibronectin type 3 domain-containing protein